jgi:hypothetical protein
MIEHFNSPLPVSFVQARSLSLVAHSHSISEASSA